MHIVIKSVLKARQTHKGALIFISKLLFPEINDTAAMGALAQDELSRIQR